MLFNSISFAVFLPTVFFIYWAIKQKYRWILLLVASYYFYMSWSIKYVLLILSVTLVTYIGAILIKKITGKRKKFVLGSIVFALVGLLFVFKYWNFTADTMGYFFRRIGIGLHPVTLQLVLPVGISFYTFQALGYVFDVYKGKVEPEKHLGKYATFISFFPQLVAGPIERTENLLPQIKGEHQFDYTMASYGLKQMAWGFLKKMVISDNLAAYVDQVYGNLHSYHGFSLMAVTFFFSFQIYCDFSGYSDIAIGTSKLFGIQLMDNFKCPYFSTSIKEFWKKWHISLSGWFQEYVYIPLGGGRKGTFRKYINLMITFLISGLWHGAAWHFVVWGGIHGVYQIGEYELYRKIKRPLKLPTIVKMIVVYCMVNFAWIFFRLDMADAWYLLKNMFVGISAPFHYIKEGFYQLEITRYAFLLLMLYFFPLWIYDWVSLKKDVICLLSQKNRAVRWMFYYAVGICILLLGIHASSTEFIYFQF